MKLVSSKILEERLDRIFSSKPIFLRTWDPELKTCAVGDHYENYLKGSGTIVLHLIKVGLRYPIFHQRERFLFVMFIITEIFNRNAKR